MNQNEMTLMRPENLREIMQAAPQQYELNRESRDRCVSVGRELLQAIRQQGMTDELDSEAQAFIDKARRTVKAMNERRAPVTKLFDQVRSAFTAVENEIDPAKAGTVGHELQTLRNQYAARKRAEEERRLREEMARRQAEEAARRFRQAVEDDFRRKFSRLVDGTLERIREVEAGLTPERYEQALQTLRAIKATAEDYVPAWLEAQHTLAEVPAGVDAAEVERAVRQTLQGQMSEQYRTEVGDAADYAIDRLPSRRAALEEMAQAKAEEAARIKAEMEARQQSDDERMARERAAREAEAKTKAEMERKAAEMTALFDEQAAVAAYQPKAKVTKKINLLNPEGIMPILSLWWSKEGCRMTVEELAKMFKRQITFCEKLANREDLFVNDESVEYVDEVKAR